MQMLYVPSWFSVDLKCGFLQIMLQEEDAFAGYIAAKDVDLKGDSRINLGRFMLIILLQNWPPLQRALESASSRPESLAGSESGQDSSSRAEDLKEELENEHATMKHLIDSGIKIPKHTIILLQEANGPNKCRLSWNQVGSEAYKNILNENIPQWMKDGALKQIANPTTKVPFILLPFQNEKR